MAKKILVADDMKRDVEYLISDSHREYGYDGIEYVSDGKSAMERIERGGLDAAILDWYMPIKGMSQYEARMYYGDKVAKKARELCPNLVLVIRSSDIKGLGEELKPYDVYCHSKWAGDEKLLEYLKSKLGE